MATREDRPARAEVVEALQKLTDLAATEDGFRELRRANAPALVVVAWTLVDFRRRQEKP